MKFLKIFALTTAALVAGVSTSVAQSCSTVLECAQQAAEAAQKANDLARLIVPKGAVVAFNLDECPSGWTEFKPAYGRFVRGIDRSGGNLDPDGERPPGEIQGHAFASHTHRYNGRAANKAPGSGGGQALGWLNQNGGATHSTGGNETRPVNVALLYCERF